MLIIVNSTLSAMMFSGENSGSTPGVFRNMFSFFILLGYVCDRITGDLPIQKELFLYSGYMAVILSMSTCGSVVLIDNGASAV